MAFEIGTAANYRDLLDKLLRFLQAKATLANLVYTGTGNGALNDLDMRPVAPTETWTLACANATKVGVANYGASVAAQSPVLHWRFNETSGTTAQDATANARNGVITGSPALGSTGLLSVDTNKSITFDGVNDQVASAAIAAVQLTGDAAIECLIKPSNISGTRFIAGVGAAGTGNANNLLISLWLVDGYLKIVHEYGNGNSQQVVTHFLCAVNRGYHVVLSRNDSSKIYQLIVGGIVRHQFAYAFPASDGANAYFSVGLDPDGLYPFAGVIDEPALYAAQISAATAAAHAQDALGHETVTVTGSVSGAQANSTVGVPYQNAFLEFTINDGSINFIVGDNWTIGIIAGGLGAQAWTINRREQDTVFLQGHGLSATDEIYVSIKTYFDVLGDRYNWQLNGFDSYSASKPIEGQLNPSPNAYLPLWNDVIPYWFVADGRRFIVAAKVSTSYQAAYAGLMLPFALPTEYRYPIAIGGSASLSISRWSSSLDSSNVFVDPGDTLHLRDVNAVWNTYTNVPQSTSGSALTDFNTHPYGATTIFNGPNFWNTTISDPNDVYPLWPITLMDSNVYSSNRGVIGVLAGCYAVTGFNNAAENIINVPGDSSNYVVLQNVFRTGLGDYWALKLA